MVTTFPEDPFEEYRRLIQQLQDAMRPDLERYRAVFRAQAEYAQEMHGAMERAMEPYRRLSESLGAAAQEMVGPIGAMQETLAEVQDLYTSPVLGLSATLQREVRQYQQLGRQLAAAIAPALSGPDFAFDDTAVGDALGRRLATLAETNETVTFADVTGAAEESLAEAAPGAAAAPYVWQLLLSIVVQVLLTWAVSNPQLAQVETRLDAVEDGVDATRRELSARISQLGWMSTPATHITSRKLVLRKEPDSAAAAIRRVNAKSGVTVLDVAGDWYLVFDRASGDAVMAVGWLYGRYVRPIGEVETAGSIKREVVP